LEIEAIVIHHSEKIIHIKNLKQFRTKDRYKGQKDEYQAKRKEQRKLHLIMHLRIWHIRVKNKYEIIIKDLGELKLGIIIFTETKKKDSGLTDSFILIVKCLKRSEQRDGFL